MEKRRYLACRLSPKEQNCSGITEKKRTCSVVQGKFFLICCWFKQLALDCLAQPVIHLSKD